MEKRWHDLSPHVLVDVFPAEGGKGIRSWLVDTRYGSNTLAVGPSRTTDILRIQHPATRVKSGGVVYEPSGS